jgi:hypothetical protein
MIKILTSRRMKDSRNTRFGTTLTTWPSFEAVKRTHDVRSSAYAWEWGFEGMRPNGPGVPEFGARMNMASAYAKLPQMQPGYFAVSPGGNVYHSVTNNVVHHKTDVHVDGSQDPKSRRAWSARISIGPTKT